MMSIVGSLTVTNGFAFVEEGEICIPTVSETERFAMDNALRFRFRIFVAGDATDEQIADLFYSHCGHSRILPVTIELDKGALN